MVYLQKRVGGKKMLGLKYFKLKKLEPKWIVVGLGNIGARYKHTRHNAGFLCIDALAEKNGIVFDAKAFGADIGYGKIGDTECLLMKPRTYMNHSGTAVAKAMKKYGINSDRLLVICDDVNFSVGALRIKRSGSSGGQNGVNSIIDELGTQAFPRIKVGVGRIPQGKSIVDWVMSVFQPEEEEALSRAKESASVAVNCVVGGDIDEAMGKFNSSK